MLKQPDIDAATVNFALYFADHGLRVLPIPAKSGSQRALSNRWRREPHPRP